jgi:CRISPR-associated protein Csd1
MTLDNERKSRDYLYGRLLAVAQNIEQWALDTEYDNKDKRLTNADRLMQRFADHPYSTWRIIELSLRPYFSKLQGKGRGRERLIDQIMGLFNPEEFIKDNKLSGEFLLGYHNQREALHSKDTVINEKVQEVEKEII